MPAIRHRKRRAYIAFALGLIALVTNVLGQVAFQTDYPVTAGNLFLYLSAGALGLQGALISLAAGELAPLLFTDTPLIHMEAIALTLTIAYCSKLMPRIPSFVVSLALWSVVIGPLFILSTNYPPSLLGEGWTVQSVVFFGLTEVLLVMISGALLLNSSLWAMLTERPRRNTPALILTHACGIIAAITLVVTFAVAPLVSQHDLLTFWDANFLQVLGAVLVILISASITGWRLAALLERDYQELFQTQLGSQARSHSFSGLSSDFWRRQAVEDDSEGSLENDSGKSITFDAVDGQEYLSPDQGICTLTKEGKVTFVNRRFKRLTDIGVTEVIGKHLSEIGMNQELCVRMLELVEEP